MALLSVKRFLTQLEEEAAYRKVISMLLEGVATHALNLDRDACRSFCERIGEIRRALASETTVESLLVDAGAAVQAIGDYARETNRLMQTQGVEMQTMIAMLAGSSADIGGVAGRASAPPQKIGNGMERAAAVEDASSLEARPQASLDDMQEDSKRPKAEPDQMVEALRRDVSRKQATSRNLGLDPVTELPWETAAQTQFLSALRAGEQKHVAVFVLGSAQRINLRFGRAAGDEVIRALKQYLAGRLESGDRMFRWSGPAIVALMASGEPIDRVRARLNRFLDKPIQQRFDSERGPESVPLSIAWSVFPLCSPLAVANRQIHEFVASQGYGDEGSITI